MFKLVLCLTICIIFTLVCCTTRLVDPSMCLVWGPGLTPDKVVLPARYFFILAVDSNGNRFRSSPPEKFVVQIKGNSPHGSCRTQIDIIDRGDGSLIVRYKVADWCDQVKIEVYYNGSHVNQSPYIIGNSVFSEKCYCPQELSLFKLHNFCPSLTDQIQISRDLFPFKRVNFSTTRDKLLKNYNYPDSISLCHYVVKKQAIWRRCYGKYTGFKMFMDATLSALRRVVFLPDMEFFLNLGDWPLSRKAVEKHHSEPYPIFSWCGSRDSYDIILPSYDITESTVENMGRVMLDILSVQRSQYPWDEKINKAFWRGRDSRRERLDLIDISRKYPELINASLTNFFFFRDEEKKYGPRVPHISFMDFFKYKYQLNIDGTVASYRFPYLLGGDGLVFKQDSSYFEHFYRQVKPYVHYIPIKHDLSDLIDKLKWAQNNEDEVLTIIRNARQFVEKNLLPQHIYCYHLTLFQEWSKRLVSPVVIQPGMERLEVTHHCSCQKSHLRDEF